MNVETIDSEAENFVRTLHAVVLKRPPVESELKAWTAMAKKLSPLALLQRISESDEYKAKNRVNTFFPIGHFHSPVVDPATLGDYVSNRRRLGAAGLSGIAIDMGKMMQFWNKAKDDIANAPFPETKTAGYRFYFEGSPFPYGDALGLHAMIGQLKPKRIVEIGSGFSTACMLDSADIHKLGNLHITCIEPYPSRLNKLLWPSDKKRVTLLEKPVQEVSVEDIVGHLEPNDILFIDSTHVLKTGSDVHYEIFDVIPAVKPGVVIHIHDCPYPFEYGQPWIEKNFSWNEAYAIRAFLMYNNQFEVLFWGSMFRALHKAKIEREGGRFGKSIGTSLWFSRSS